MKLKKKSAIIKKFRPLYNLFVPGGLLYLSLSFFPTEHTLDIHLHDTVYIIEVILIFRAIAFVLIGFWILYLLSNKILALGILTKVHVIATLMLTMYITLPFVVESFWHPMDTHREIFSYLYTNNLLTIAIVVFLMTQYCFG